MFQTREFPTAAAVLAVTTALADINPRSTSESPRDRDVEVVRSAADQLAYETVSDAWAQSRLGATAALTGIAGAVDLRYLATHQDGDEIILTFDGHESTCIDLISAPAANTVETRRCYSRRS